MAVVPTSGAAIGAPAAGCNAAGWRATGKGALVRSCTFPSCRDQSMRGFKPGIDQSCEPTKKMKRNVSLTTMIPNFLIALGLALAACQASAFSILKPDPELDWAAEYALGQQIRDVLWDLQRDHAMACGEHVVGQTGIQLAMGEHRWDSLEAFYEASGWSYGNTIIAIAKGSPADLAGLRIGDVITRVDGKRIKERDDHDDAIENQERLNKAEKRRDRFEVEYVRDGEERAVTLVPEKVCDVRLRALQVHYAVPEEFEDNESMVTPEYLAIARDPQAVRILATHEFAHHVEGHYRRDGLLGAAANIAHFAGAGQAAYVLAGAVSLSKQDEDEIAADALAVTMLADEGIAPSDVLALFQRLRAATEGKRLDGRLLEPISDARLAALETLAAAHADGASP